MLHCFYVDHTFYSEIRLGEISENLKVNGDIKVNADNVLLITCHRIELYTTDHYNNDPLVKVTGINSKRLNDQESILLRLTKIIAGVKSKILGEKFIIHQVKNAFERNSINPKIIELYYRALSIAMMVRKKHLFYSNLDYNDIALKLSSGSSNSIKNNECSVIIGGGMLALGMLTKFKRNNCKKIIMVTRQPKKLKRKVKDDAIILSANSLISSPLEVGHDCLIATTNLNGAYKSQVHSIISNSLCSKVIDFSAVPRFKESLKQKNYITIYCNEFQQIVESGNKSLVESTSKIEDAINFHFEEDFKIMRRS